MFFFHGIFHVCSLEHSFSSFCEIFFALSSFQYTTPKQSLDYSILNKTPLPNAVPCILFLLRKEVIHPHLPVGIPCYDFTPIIYPTFDGCLLAVSSPASGVTNSRGVTGGVYKTRERIHRSMLTCDY